MKKRFWVSNFFLGLFILFLLTPLAVTTTGGSEHLYVFFNMTEEESHSSSKTISFFSKFLHSQQIELSFLEFKGSKHYVYLDNCYNLVTLGLISPPPEC
jgi:hypothetical protein